jgi:hypothetical protein
MLKERSLRLVMRESMVMERVCRKRGYGRTRKKHFFFEKKKQKNFSEWTLA